MLNFSKRTLFAVVLIIILTSSLTYAIAVHFNPKLVVTTSEDGSKSIHVLSEKDYRIFRELRPLIKIIKIIETRYVEDVKIKKLVEGAIRGAINALGDPHTAYFTPQDFENLKISLHGSYEGIGITVTLDEEGRVTVISPIEDSPAARAGIRPEDRIIRVNDTDLKGLTLNEAVQLMRGPKGTHVTLFIRRKGHEELLKFDIVRDAVKLKTVKSKILNGNIGYVKITSFDENTGSDFKKVLHRFKNKGIKGLILDLRNNPGGALAECVKVADELIGKSLIVYTKDRYGNIIEEFRSDAQKIAIPLVVLINKYSASASEIVAGAVKDTNSGILIGSKTFGKGSVQELVSFEDGSGLKITIAKYYLPKGSSIDGIGIEPHIEVELPEGTDVFNVGESKDLQLKKAIEVIEESSRR